MPKKRGKSLLQKLRYEEAGRGKAEIRRSAPTYKLFVVVDHLGRLHLMSQFRFSHKGGGGGIQFP